MDKKYSISKLKEDLDKFNIILSVTGKNGDKNLQRHRRSEQYNPQVCFAVPTYNPEKSHNTNSP